MPVNFHTDKVDSGLLAS